MEKVIEELQHINRTLEGMMGIMGKPENKLVKALTVSGTGVGALGIIHIIDTIVSWLGGR